MEQVGVRRFLPLSTVHAFALDIWDSSDYHRNYNLSELHHIQYQHLREVLHLADGNFALKSFLRITLYGKTTKITFFWLCAPKENL